MIVQDMVRSIETI